MADVETSWTWNFTGPTTMSKAQSRPFVPKEIAWDLIGFDGNETGALRTHPGFKALDGSGASFTPISSPANVIGFFPVSVLTSGTSFVYGYIWVEIDSSQLKFYAKFANAAGWLTATPTNGLLATFSALTHTSSTEVDVQVIGRYLMLFVRGETPKMVLLSETGGPPTTNWNATVSSAGPGAAPVAAVSGAAATNPTGSRTGSGNVDFYVYQGGSGGTSLSAGTYSFAVQYMSTETGRKSALSNVITITAGGSNNHFQFKTIRLTSDYNRALIYRTVNMGNRTGASVYGAGAMHLEQVVTLSSSSVVTTYNSSTDNQLVYQDVYIDKGKSDTYVPPGGTAGFLGSTLFITRILDSANTALTELAGTTPDTPPRSIGDMRWSSTGEIQPENFLPSNRWVPRTPGNEIIGMRQVGNYMVAFSADRLYRIGRSGQFIKYEEGHLGYGLVGRNALEAIGTMVYFVSGGGLKAVSAEGQVEDVTALDNLINATWASTKQNLQLAYDARGQCLTILQPDTGAGTANGRSVMLWFGTNRVTELVDLPFRFMKTGFYYSNAQVQRRAMFVKRNSSTTMGVYIVDHERSVAYPKNLCGGTPTFSGNLDPVSTTEFDCAAYDVSTGARTSAVTAASGTAVCSMAPLVQQWVGGNIGMTVGPEMPEFKDFFRQKQVSSCRSYFETLAVPGTLPSTSTWRAVVYRGTETDAYTTGQPLTHSGTPMGSFSTSATNPGYAANAPFGRHGVLWSSLSPGWRCDIVGVDVRLLAFSAVGRILDSDRRYV